MIVLYIMEFIGLLLVVVSSLLSILAVDGEL